VVELWRPVAERHGIRLEIGGAPAIERFDADRGKLRRVLDNLVKNAIEAIGEGPGEVTITTSVSGSEKLRISIEDTGCGIPENVQVFRLFETTKPDGSGLGLPVSKQILIAHGGNLVFDARSPHGSVFHVELPLRRDATA
jgi:signal transduction histidine kinase